jgi:hypothetical protein
MNYKEASVLLEDLKISCVNHIRGTGEETEIKRFRERKEALDYAIHILQTLRDVKMPETKGKYEGVDEPLKISSLYVWNKYNEGFDLALQEI